MKKRVAVYCASSSNVKSEFLEDAYRFGRHLALAGHSLVYGGGKAGLMGNLADGALSGGGRVTGVIPGFMMEQELGHTGLAELIVVGGMHERQRLMLEKSDHIVALPGGCGTLYELIEAITWKRLGLIGSPVIIYNQEGYYTPLVEMLERSVDYGFLGERFRSLWQVADSYGELAEMLEFPEGQSSRT